jgi:chemotaxis protein MotB
MPTLMTNALRTLGAIALVSLTLGGCGKARELAHAKVEITELERQVAELEAALAACEAGKGSSAAAPAPAPTPSGMGSDVDVFGRDKDIVMSISDDILFRPGSAVLTDKAKTTLNRVVGELKAKYGSNEIRVEGHTDSDPITKSKDKWEDNWDLSGGRARSVLHYLVDHGINAKGLGFAGYADQRPRTPGDKPRNRRVEIVIITHGK